MAKNNEMREDNLLPKVDFFSYWYGRDVGTMKSRSIILGIIAANKCTVSYGIHGTIVWSQQSFCQMCTDPE